MRILNVMNRKHHLVLGILMMFLFVTGGCAIKPVPLTPAQIMERAARDMNDMFADQEPIDGPVDLYTAMARALKYNLSHRLELMEKTLSRKNLDVSRFDLLPEMAASAGYQHRSEYDASHSLALNGPDAGTIGPVDSTSDEKDNWTADVSVMWNVLDFALGYYQTQQEADRVLIAEEIRRRVIQNILQEVQSTYWRAAGTEALLRDMRGLIDQAGSALARSREISGQKLKPSVQTLTYQREMLDNVRILWGLIRTLKTAETELAALMNVKPGTAFEIMVPDDYDIPLFSIPMPHMEQIALENRPELRQADYQARISATEVKKTIVDMLPGLNLSLGANYDSNDFLYENDWWSAGTGISLNILNVIAGPSRYRAARTRESVDRLRRQAQAMAVLAQVHIARRQFDLLKEEFTIADQLEQVDTALYRQLEAERAAGRGVEMRVIQNSTEAMLSRVRKHLAYAELRRSAAMTFFSLGIDLMPETIASGDVKALARELEASFTKWERRMNPRG